MAPSKLDTVYRRMLLTRFFEKGWGNPENLQRLIQFRKIMSRRETCFPLVPKDYKVEILKEDNQPGCVVMEGKFLSPLELHLPGIVPKAARDAHFQVILPTKWTSTLKPVCIHLAGTGDHFFWRRRKLMAMPLLRESNIGSIILENPFYGSRKPADQVRSNLHNVSDIFVMGGCLILECLVLLHWCERNAFGPLGITGLSMGGHMASLAAANWPKPLVLVPCLSWSTAATAFTTGIMSHSVNWDLLESQYYLDTKYSERLSKMVTVADDAFTGGQTFIRNFNQSLIELKKGIKYTKLFRTNQLFGNATILTSRKCDTHSSLTSMMNRILPKSRSIDKFDSTKINWWEREALQFMRGVMDECTNLRNFSVPRETSLIIVVCAKDDAYVPRDDCTRLEEIWPGAEVRYVDAGHVSAYVLHQRLFRSCISEAFERATHFYIYKYKSYPAENIDSTLTYSDLLDKYVNSYR